MTITRLLTVRNSNTTKTEKFTRFLSLTFVVLLSASYSNAARILAAFVFPGKSHFMMNQALIRELVHRGHEVTFLTNFPMEKNLGSNYTEVLIEPIYDFWTDIQNHFNAKSIFELTSLSLDGFLKMLDILALTTTEHALKQPKIREIFERQDTENIYDLLIAEQFCQEAFLTLGLKYNIPVITMSTFGYANYMSQIMGYISPWSFVPHGFLPYDDNMTFWQRVRNTFASLYEDYVREYNYFPKQDALIQKYLSHLPMKIPKVSEMEKNVSLLLLNSHVALTTPRPSMPGMISVGGMHIYPPKPLPADLQKFIDEATDGVIFFSLGSNVQSADMPTEKLNMFLEVFAGLKQRVIWKFEDDRMKNMPKNIMIKKWLPQSDILAHPNVKVFITHGGLFGTQEGVHYGVPMLGIPIYCDQVLNMNKATKSGYAITLLFPTITKDSLKQSLTDLIENPRYRENIKRYSQIFRDRPLSARDTAMYWVDYIIRYKGAPHMRSSGHLLAWYEFYLLDVIGFIVLGVIAVLTATVLLIKFLLRKKNTKEKSN